MSARLQIARVQAGNGDRQAALGTLRSAYRASRLIIGDGSRVSALIAIALAEAQAGEKQSAGATLQEALRIGRLITAPLEYTRPECLAHIARAQFLIGDVEAARRTVQEALQAAQSIKGPEIKILALGKVALAQSRTGMKEAARETIEVALRELNGNRNTAMLYSLHELATAHVEVSGFEQALQTARSVPDSTAREISYAVVIGQLAAGKCDAALETARASRGQELSQNLLLIAMTQAYGGEVIGAQDTLRDAFEKIEDSVSKERDSLGSPFAAFALLAITQAKVGLSSEATTTVKDHLLPQWGDSAFLLTYLPSVDSYCRAQVNHGGAVQTYELANDIPIASDQVVLLVCLAEVILEQQKSALSKTSSDSNQPAK